MSFVYIAAVVIKERKTCFTDVTFKRRGIRKMKCNGNKKKPNASKGRVSLKRQKKGCPCGISSLRSGKAKGESNKKGAFALSTPIHGKTL